MPSVYDLEAFPQRVNYAAQVISKGARTTRHFDTCFEMHDGDAVAVAVFRRSLNNPRLRKNLWRYIGRDSVLPIAWANRRRPRSSFDQWARELREKGHRDFEAMMASIDAERAA